MIDLHPVPRMWPDSYQVLREYSLMKEELDWAPGPWPSGSTSCPTGLAFGSCAPSCAVYCSVLKPSMLTRIRLFSMAGSRGLTEIWEVGRSLSFLDSFLIFFFLRSHLLSSVQTFTECLSRAMHYAY